jgi:hypothetical protein
MSILDCIHGYMELYSILGGSGHRLKAYLQHPHYCFRHFLPALLFVRWWQYYMEVLRAQKCNAMWDLSNFVVVLARPSLVHLQWLDFTSLSLHSPCPFEDSLLGLEQARAWSEQAKLLLRDASVLTSSMQSYIHVFSKSLTVHLFAHWQPFNVFFVPYSQSASGVLLVCSVFIRSLFYV